MISRTELINQQSDHQPIEANANLPGKTWDTIDHYL